MLEYTLINRTRQSVAYDFSFHLSNLVQPAIGERPPAEARSFRGSACTISTSKIPVSESFGTAALVALNHQPRIKAMWFRGGWFDGISALWREVSTETFTTNEGSNPNDTEGRSGGSILFTGGLPPGRRITYPVLIAWHFPNSNQRHGEPKRPLPDAPNRSLGPAWRPFYAGQWKDAKAVADRVVQSYPSLRERTSSFSRALQTSTLPPSVVDAVSANLAILKSPTVLRQENGNIWGWEGCFPDAGCCHGSCTHVWNYAQALAAPVPQARANAARAGARALDGRARPRELPRRATRRSGRPRLARRSRRPARRHHEGLPRLADLRRRRLAPPHVPAGPAQPRILHPHLGSRRARRALRAPPQHLRHRVLGPRRNVHQHLHRRALGHGRDGPRAWVSPTMRLATKSSPEPAREILDQELFNGEYFTQKVMTGGLRDRSFSEKLEAMPRQQRGRRSCSAVKGPSTNTEPDVSQTA